MWESCDPLLDFWDPLIFRGQLKLENSNLAQIWTAVSNNEKNAKLGQKVVVMWGSRDPLLEFWDPRNILGTNEARNFKFDNNNNNLCLIWLRQTTQPYNIIQYYTTVCHAGQQ